MSTLREITLDAATGVVTTTDARTVEACREGAIALLDALATSAILLEAPEHKQRNAALGLLSQVEADAIRSSITTWRARFAGARASIEAVAWDGQESTRAACCDYIQSITL